jgi:hypothetical protein
MNKILHSALFAVSAAIASGSAYHAAPSYDTVFKELDAHGSNYLAFVELSGDFAKIGARVNQLMAAWQQDNGQQLPFPVDVELLLKRLGFTSVQALGVASKQLADGVHQTTSFLPLSDRSGLWALAGEAPFAFALPATAPADADLVAEFYFLPNALVSIVRQLANDMAGQIGVTMMEQGLNAPQGPAGLSIGQAIDALSGRARFVLIIEPQGDDPLNTDFHGWLELESPIQPLKQAVEVLRGGPSGAPPIDIDGVTRMRLPSFPINERVFQPLVDVDFAANKITVYLDSTSINRRQAAGPRLADHPDFQRLAHRLPGSGQSFAYGSARYASFAARAPLATLMDNPSMRGVATLIDGMLPALSVSQASATWWTDAGLKTVSFTSGSIKAQLAATIMTAGAALFAHSQTQRLAADQAQEGWDDSMAVPFGDPWDHRDEDEED